jgi:hypothetical protein
LQRILICLFSDIFALLCRLQKRVIASAHLAFQIAPKTMNRA